MGVTPPGGPAGGSIPPRWGPLPPQVRELLDELFANLSDAKSCFENDPKKARADFDRALKILSELQEIRGVPPDVRKTLPSMETDIADISMYVGQPGTTQAHTLDLILQSILNF